MQRGRSFATPLQFTWFLSLIHRWCVWRFFFYYLILSLIQQASPDIVSDLL